MSDTKIEWADKVWNPIRGCSLVSAGCTNCYAMKQAHRFSGIGQAYEGLTRLTRRGPVWTGKVRLIEEHLKDPLRWKKPRRIFVNSMSDLFHESLSDESIDRVFAVMGACEDAERGHVFQILTKRAERMFDYVSKRGYDAWNSYRLAAERWPASNIWFGVSAENQLTADTRIPWLIKTPANVRWISYEPALGPVRFDDPPPSSDRPSWFYRYEDVRGNPETNQIHWVVVGGESGPKARPFDVQWALDTIKQCKAAKVSCFVKQLGALPCIDYHPKDALISSIRLKDKKGGDWLEWEGALRVREYPKVF